MRFKGVDQTTAWALALVSTVGLYGLGYGVTRLLSKRAAAAEPEAATADADEETHVRSADELEYGRDVEGEKGEKGEKQGAAEAKEPGEAPKKAEGKAHGAAAEKADEAEAKPKGEHADDGASASVPWNYKGSNGPEHWSELSEAFKTCASGRAQSPIDFEAPPTNGKLLPIRFHYKDSDATVRNTGRDVSVTLTEGNYVEIDGDRYDLTGIAFHTPSEHKVAGIPYDGEAQLFHKDAEGHVAVIGVLFEEGAGNKTLALLLKDVPSDIAAAPEPVAVNPEGLLPQRRLYYRYQGSLTTPPCTEGVAWYVLTSPATVSAKQIDALVAVSPFNARPVHPLAGRHVTKSAR